VIAGVRDNPAEFRFLRKISAHHKRGPVDGFGIDDVYRSVWYNCGKLGFGPYIPLLFGIYDILDVFFKRIRASRK
jgi:hypothetical protein